MSRDLKSRRRQDRANDVTPYHLRLFVAGEETNSAMARASLSRICEDHLKGKCRIEIIDVLKDFRPALQENILVTPALIVQRAETRTVIFGNLTDVDKVLTALQIGSDKP